MLFINIIYVLLAVAMIALILMQRGAGAQAGSGFGGGASGTVFGARGSSSFLTKATKWLAVAFFVLSMFMAFQATRSLRGGGDRPTLDLGVMSQVPATPATAPGSGAAVPAAPTQPQARPQPATEVPQAPAQSAVPVAPAAEQAPPAPASQQPDPAQAPPSGG